MKDKIEIYFEDLDIEGYAVGYISQNDRTGKIKAVGVLPGERAIVTPIKKTGDSYLTIPLEITEKSEYRTKEKEDHFLSCSPWQITTYQYQLLLKKEILRKIWGTEVEIEPSSRQTGYRTKMEFSFYIDQKPFLAFFKRGSFKAKYKLTNGCILADEKLNSFALKILNSLSTYSSDKLFKILKGLTVRQSKGYNQYLAGLFVKNEDFKLQVDLEENEGLQIYYSDPKSPAFVFTSLISKQKIEEIKERVLNIDVYYGLASFFQNNIPLFESALENIKKHLNNSAEKVVDLYCGVGVIGLNLAELSKKVIGVEINEQACNFAKFNAKLNNINNFEVLCLPVEKLNQELLKNTEILTVDPPRTGLHPKLIKFILNEQPKKIVYLSCNPATQYRDYELLKEKYNITFIKAYDFYPLTTHIESLLILDKK
ncbi:MAG: class I SAM-dependent RNA methyltransferase [bacterium]